ncbi:sirohydrochlorin chelatase [Leptolyngbya sp. FACHB-261]|uniref:sirohydrochlorin chelatase n=1 Tax=Leptolyngbya sp. FACHB-261 TaxID=2692806 RepID=UPI0028C44208|nr:sirohydrochlorin chelatase [Leptolyngbya sp. FACHB-261]
MLALTIPKLDLEPLPLQRPLLLVGHGTRDAEGRQSFLDFATAYQQLDHSRPVLPCFLELTEPSIQNGVDQCVEAGHLELSVLPVLLFAARHNKFDVTNELDRAKQRHPGLQLHYGRHFGITPSLLNLWNERLAALDQPEHNPEAIPRSETVLLFVGRGSSDPDANGDACKLARLLWEGSGYASVETCFIGITHPRLEEGFRRARLDQPRRIIVLPHFLFTGALVKKIVEATEAQQALFPHLQIDCLPEIGLHPDLFLLLRERERETQLGEVRMNCEMCKFRLMPPTEAEGHGHAHGHAHAHGHDHGHSQEHGHGHSHSHGSAPDSLAEPAAYHQRVWQTP